MKILFSYFVVCLLFASPVTHAQQIRTGTWQGYEVEYVDGQISIRLREGYNPERITEIVSRYEGEIVINFDKLGWGLAQLPEGSDIFSVIARSQVIPIEETCSIASGIWL